MKGKTIGGSLTMNAIRKRIGVLLVSVILVVLLGLSACVICISGILNNADNQLLGSSTGVISESIRTVVDSNVVDSIVINEEAHDNYTNSDQLYGGQTNYTIQDYKTTLYQTTSSIVSEGASLRLSGGSDDPIVNIVPKSLFANVGEYLHIGKEYGFFVRTFSGSNPSTNGGAVSLENNNSYVMVFDIENDNDLENQAGVINLVIKPLFQYEYVYLKSATANTFYISNQQERVEKNYVHTVSYQNTPNDLVVPVGFSASGTSMVYDEIDKYYISDVSMQMSLLNENSLNESMPNYNVQDDLGSFFTSMDYEYDGQKREAGEFPSDQLHAFGLDMFEMAVGTAISCIPGAEPAWSMATNGLETAYELTNHVIKIADGFDKYKNGVISNVSTGKITTQDFFPDKLSQIIDYDKLVKAVSLAINTDSDESVWFGNDNFVRGKFKISQSASAVEDIEYTRLIRDIGLKIVDKDKPLNAEHVITSVSSYDFNIRNKNYKEINDQQLGNINILPNGINMFIFNPQYSGNYEFDFSNLVGTGCDIFIAGNIKNLEGGMISAYVKASEGVQIEIRSNSAIVITSFSNDVSLNEIGSLFNMKDTNHIIKVEVESFINLSTTNSAVKIKTIFNYNNGYIVDAKNVVMTPASTFDANFVSGGFRYVLLNSSSVNLNVSFKTNSLDVVSLNNEKSVSGNANGRILKFTSLAVANTYVMTLNNIGVGVGLYSSTDEKLEPNSLVGENKALSFDAVGGQSIYIKITFESDANDSVDTLIKQSANSIVWYTSENGVNYERVLNGAITTKRGDITYIKAMYNDKVQITDASKFKLSNDEAYPGVNFDGEKFVFGKNAVFRNIAVGHDDLKLITYNEGFGQLVISCEIEDEVDVEATKEGTGVRVRWYNAKYIYGYNLNIDNGYGKELNIALTSPNFACDVTQFISLEQIMDSALIQSTNFGAFTYSITNITYGSSPVNIKGDHNVISNQVSLNVLFSSGVGSVSNPFKISSVNEFNNLGDLEMRNPAIRYYKQTSNINYNYKSPKSIGLQFKGHYDGGNKTISNIKITSLDISQITNSINVDDDSIGGLFGEILSGSEVSNVNISNLKIESNTYALYLGGVAGTNNGDVANVNTTGIIDVYNIENTGGVVGLNFGEVTDCDNNIPVIGYDVVGGVVGFNYGIIDNCSSTYDIDTNGNGYYYVDTICGKDFGDIINC